MVFGKSENKTLLTIANVLFGILLGQRIIGISGPGVQPPSPPPYRDDWLLPLVALEYLINWDTKFVTPLSTTFVGIIFVLSTVWFYLLWWAKFDYTLSQQRRLIQALAIITIALSPAIFYFAFAVLIEGVQWLVHLIPIPGEKQPPIDLLKWGRYFLFWFAYMIFAWYWHRILSSLRTLMRTLGKLRSLPERVLHVFQQATYH